jgi:hypothetical protein
MRHVWEHPEEARAVGERARYDLYERFSLERSAVFLEGRLEKLRAKGSINAHGSRHDARQAIVEASRTLAPDIGAALEDDRSLRPTSFVRRLLRRALWPELARQQRLDTALINAVTSLQRSIDDIERRVHQLEGASRQNTADEPPRRSR